MAVEPQPKPDANNEMTIKVKALRWQMNYTDVSWSDCVRWKSRPVFLKVAPRDDPAARERLLAECEGFDFVRGFCFNLPAGKPEALMLSTSRDPLTDKPGAVAGRPVAAHINRCIAGLFSRMDRNRYKIIGAGGVFNAQDAYEKVRLGALLVQLHQR